MSISILLCIIGTGFTIVFPLIGFPPIFSLIIGIPIFLIGVLTKVIPSYITIFKKDSYYTSFKAIVFFGHFVFALISLLIVGFITD